MDNRKFSVMFNLAISDWPSSISLEDINRLSGSGGKYTVKGLSSIRDEVEEKYVGSVEEVLYVNLHTAIYTCLLQLAMFVRQAKVGELRPDYVQEIFDSRLKKSLARDDLNWSVLDKSLVTQYLKTNKN